MLRILTALFLLLAVSGTAQAQSWVAAPEPLHREADRPPPPDAWVEVPGTWLTVHGHPERYELLLRLARHGAEALPRLSDELGVPVGRTVHVYVARTQEQFRTLQPGNAPTWADATAYPGMGTVFLRDPKIRIATDEPVEQVLDHELVHILLGRAFAPAIPPSWLQEGVAQLLAGQIGAQTSHTLSSAALSQSLVKLETLERGFPRNPRNAQVAYAESADFVQYLRDQHGDDVVPRLVRSVMEGRDLAGAVFAVTARRLPEVEADWRSRWTFGVGWTAGFLGRLGEYVFGIGGLMLVVAGVLRRRQFRRRLQEMEEEEALVDALMAEMRTPSVAAGADRR